jgi:hypothetical protein
VDGGQGDDEPDVWGGGRGDGFVDVRLDEGLEDATGLPRDTDADRGVAENLTVLLRVPETGWTAIFNGTDTEIGRMVRVEG